MRNLRNAICGQQSAAVRISSKSAECISMRATFVVCLLVLASVVSAAKLKRPDFYAYNADGSVRIRGVYDTDAAGRVTKYTVYDGAGKLQYTEIPYYAPAGRIVRADHFDANGKLSKIVVYFDKVVKVFNPAGELLESQSFSQDEFLRARK